jgi:hypothetical protein
MRRAKCGNGITSIYLQIDYSTNHLIAKSTSGRAFVSNSDTVGSGGTKGNSSIFGPGEIARVSPLSSPVALIPKWIAEIILGDCPRVSRPGE